MKKFIPQFAFAIIALYFLTGCAPYMAMHMPPTTVTADQSGRVHASYPNLAQTVARRINQSFGPVLYEETRSDGTELSDGWVEFESDQRIARFIINPNGITGECFVKYKDMIFIKKIIGPNWRFSLPNNFDSSTRDYDLYFRYEDGSERLVTTITIVSSVPASLRTRGVRH